MNGTFSGKVLLCFYSSLNVPLWWCKPLTLVREVNLRESAISFSVAINVQVSLPPRRTVSGKNKTATNCKVLTMGTGCNKQDRGYEPIEAGKNVFIFNSWLT